MSLLHYPALPAQDILSGTHTRIPAHSDFDTLTLLFQDDIGGFSIAESGSANSETRVWFEKEGRSFQKGKVEARDYCGKSRSLYSEAVFAFSLP